MEEIIAPVPKELLLAELTPDKMMRKTNRGDNEIYVVDWRNAPNTLREIGRLREICFRAEGGSSGLSMDIDEFDTMEKPYQQLLVWDPEAQAILGGYRFILGSDIVLDGNGQPHLATAHMYHFSEEFIRDYMPHTIELGRSFVAPEYQSSKAGAKGLFALDNLWDGLATLMILHRNQYFFFGKMTMYSSYEPLARDLIIHFFRKHFPGGEDLVYPIEPYEPALDARLAQIILREEDFKKDYVCLKDAVKTLGTNIPPLVNSYMQVSRSTKMLGAAVFHEFSDAVEICILLPFDDMENDKRHRHVDSYMKQWLSEVQRRFPGMSESVKEKVAQQWNKHRLRGFFRWRRGKGKESQSEPEEKE